jgi:O-antigen/teichoic acid export membrane protein
VKSLGKFIEKNNLIVVNAGSLIGTTAVTSGLGFAYWWIAARNFSPDIVGFASAMVSAMMLLGTISTLGLNTLLIGELPRLPGKEVSLITTALIVAGGVGTVIGLLFSYTAPVLSNELRVLGATVQVMFLFAIGVGLTSFSIVFDEALIGLFRGELQLSRNILFASSKLGALFVVSAWSSQAAGLTIYATWIFGSALSLSVLIAFLILRRSGGSKDKGNYVPRWQLLWPLVGRAIRHQILNLLLQAPGLGFPVLVTVILSVKVNAWFYVSWTIANVLAIVPASLSTVLYAVNSANPALLAYKLRNTLLFSFVFCSLGISLIQFGSETILGLFGHIYAQEASSSLRILSVGAFALIIKYHFIALCRIRGTMEQAIFVLTLSAALELGFAALGAHLGGLSGLCMGWIAALGIEAVLMFYPIYKVVRPVRFDARL